MQVSLKRLRKLAYAAFFCVAFLLSGASAVAAPSITSLSPTSGAIGASVTVTGTNFGTTQGSSTISFNGVAGTPTSWANAKIVVPVPAGATTGNVVVTVSGVSSAGVSFSVVPAPSIANLSPNAAPIGTSITVSGSGFGATQGSSTIKFGTKTATPTSWSDASIVVPVPSGAATGNVVVHASGVDSNGVNFTVLPVPGITSLSPTSGAIGAAVTVTGTNFGATQGTSAISFNGVTGAPTSWANTKIVVPVPAGATTGNVVVTVSGVASTGVSFSVVPAPSIASLSPNAAPVGTSVTVSGSGFGATQGSSTIKFGTKTATPTSWSDASIVVPVPTGAATGNVVVHASGVGSNGVNFTVLPVPGISSLSPTSAAIGASVTVTGTNFGATQGTSTIRFNGTEGTATSWTNTKIVAPVPAGATTGNVVITVSGVSSAGTGMTVLPAPSIASISPAQGPVGASVTIAGAGFGVAQGSSTVKFNNKAGAPVSWSDTNVVVAVPSGATTGNVVIHASGLDSNAVAFTVLPTPNITSAAPTTGTAGTLVTINGTNFGSPQGTSTVTFNGTSGTPTSWTKTKIVVPVPLGATTGPIVVTVQGVSSNLVTMTLPPTLTGISPTSGIVGASVTVTGTNLGSTQGGSVLAFNGTPATATSWSPTSISTHVPPGATTGTVTIIVAGVASNGVNFTVNHPALSSIIVTPANQTITAGSTLQFGATGFYADGSSQDVTGSAAWSSSSPSVATIAASGVASAIAAGQTTIQASIGSVNGSTPLTVTSGSTQGPFVRLRIDDSPASVNLSDPVNLDWVTWGSSYPTPIRQTGTPLISNVTPVNADQAIGSSQGYVVYSWTNGTPVATGTQVASQVISNQNATGSGFQLTVPADTNPRTLKIYGGVQGNAKLSASISDGSSPAISDTSVTGGGETDKTYSIDFRAASAGQTLTVTLTTNSANGYVTLQAAALLPHLPEVAFTTPQDSQSFAAPSSVSIALSATQIDSDVSSASVSADGAQLFSWTSSPYSNTWTSPPSGHHKLQAQATDSSGLSGAAKPVEVDEIASGGTLAVSLGQSASPVDLTAEGTADWILFGLSNDLAKGPSRKQGVSTAISNFKQIGNHPANLSTCCAPEQFSFSDGIPDQQETAINPSVYIDGLNNGYELSVAADTTPRTLRLYAAVAFGKAKLQAFLSDGSSPAVVDESLDNTDGEGQTVYAVHYSAASASQTLTVRLTIEKEYDWANLDLYAATLSGSSLMLPPHVDSAQPTSGAVGDRITITGNGFGSVRGPSTVTFNSIVAATTFWSGERIDAQVPPGNTTGPIQVIVSGLASNTDVMFTAAPQITGITPSIGPVGTTVTLTGGGFGGPASPGTVMFSGVPATASSWADTQVVVTVPSGATSGPVQAFRAQSAVGSNTGTFLVTGSATSAPVLQVRPDISPTSVTLSDPVNLDWILWGADGNSPAATRRTGTPLISDFTVIPADATPSGGTFGSVQFNWTGGSPTNTGISVSATANVSGQGSGFQITVSADTTVKTLRLFTGFVNSAQLNVSLSDGSSPAISLPVSAPQFATTFGTYVIDFRAASAGQTLTVQWICTDPDGSVYLEAATLRPHLPEVEMLFPRDGQVFPANVDVAVDAMQFDSPIPSVQVLANGNAALTMQTQPYFGTLMVSPGHYSLQATATDSSGLTGSSTPVEVDVVGSGGGLSATLNSTIPSSLDLTSEGTADWILFVPRDNWSLPNPQNYTGIVRKAGVQPRLSNYSVIGGGTTSFGCNFDSAENFAFEDGAPDSQESDVSCHVSSRTVKGGFEITTPADTTQRTLHLYAGVVNGRAKLTAFLSDGSSPPVIDTQVMDSTFRKDAIYAITYRAASPGQTLTVRWTLDEAFNPNEGDLIVFGHVTLSAATLSGSPVLTAPSITSILPVSVAPGDLISITGASFGGDNGTNSVSIGGLPATVVSWSDSLVQAVVPSNACTGSVIVTSGNGLSSNAAVLTISQSISIVPANAGLVVGQALQLQAVGGACGGSLSGATWQITSSTPNGIATLSSGDQPTLTGLAAGTLTVAVNTGGSSSAANFMISAQSAPSTPPAPPDDTTLPTWGSTNSTVTVTNAMGYQTTYTSFSVGGKQRFADASGPGCSTCSVRGNSHSTYDNNGNLVAITDALGHVTRFTYDAANDITSQAAQIDGSSTFATTSYTYNALGQVLTKTDALGRVTVNEYDPRGNLVAVVSPAPDGGTAPSITRFAYDDKGELIQVTDPLGRQTAMTYTPGGLLATIVDVQQNVTSFEYDASGNRTALVDAMHNRTMLGYNSRNRLASVRYPDGSTTALTYDSRGRRTSLTDQNGKTTTYSYDDADRMTSVTDAANGVTVYSYDLEDGLLSTTDAMGRATGFTRDSLERVTQTTFPSFLTENYAYDAVGNMTSKTDRKGQTIQYAYDARNRLTQKQYPDTSKVTFVYDLLGKIQSVDDPTGTYAFTYDNKGRLTEADTSYSFLSGRSFTTRYGYDPTSRRVSFIDPENGTTNYAYDTLGRLSSIALPAAYSGGGSFGFFYDALNRRTQLTRPNGVNTNYSYDNLSRLLGQLHQVGSTSLDGSTYSLDASGNRISRTDQSSGVTSIYSYDPIYQLTGMSQMGATKESYVYDPAGNRLESQGVASYTSDVGNELTATSLASYTYDRNGNTVAKTDSSGTTTYSWDFENRLTSVTLPGAGGMVAFKYDPFGRRVYKSTPSLTGIFAYDGDNLIETVSSSGTVIARYSQTQNVDEPLAEVRSGATSFYEADALGTITSLTSPSGVLADTYTYDSFGNSVTATGTTNNPFRFAGREFDAETGLYFDRARYYDPSIGRFLSEDPVGLKAGINRYTYVGNSPVNATDPSGLCPPKLCDPSGTAAVPGYYAELGNTANWLQNDINLFEFHRGGSLDAQVRYGGSPAYANYVYGVYLAAAGYSLPTALAFADWYGQNFSHYDPSRLDPSSQYPHIPAENVANISAGFKDEQNGTLCVTSLE